MIEIPTELLFVNVHYSIKYSVRMATLYCTIFIEFVKICDFGKYAKLKSTLYIRILK